MSDRILGIMRHLMGNETVDVQLAKWSQKIEADWRRLSDGERVTLMGLCCRGCGTLKLPCHCENDE